MVFPLCDWKAGETAQVVWITSEPAFMGAPSGQAWAASESR